MDLNEYKKLVSATRENFRTEIERIAMAYVSDNKKFKIDDIVKIDGSDWRYENKIFKVISIYFKYSLEHIISPDIFYKCRVLDKRGRLTRNKEIYDFREDCLIKVES